MKAYIFSILSLVFLCLSCKGQETKRRETIPPAVFAEKIKTVPNVQLLDVRTPEEFAKEHIDHAENLNWNSTDFIAQAVKYDKTKPVFVYCLSGGRSKQAAGKLEELGFTKIYELEGGIVKWNASGLGKSSTKADGMSLKEYNTLIVSDKKILIDVYAKWCAPCKKMDPYLTKMKTDLSDKVTIIRIDADANKSLLKELKIEELPTLILYDKSVVKWTHSGFISEEDLKKQLQ
jgi:rhodanese-related sulfurtransferase